MCLDVFDWELKPLDDTMVTLNVVGDQGPMVLHVRDDGVKLVEPKLPATVKHLNEEWHEPALFIKAMLDAKLNIFPGLRFVSDHLAAHAEVLAVSFEPRVVVLLWTDAASSLPMLEPPPPHTHAPPHTTTHRHGCFCDNGTTRPARRTTRKTKVSSSR